MQAVIYTTAKWEELRINCCRKEMNCTGKINKCSYWGVYDVTFDLVLQKFGADLSDLDCPVEPKRKFRCWIKDWELPLANKNDCVVESDILEKYKVFILY